MPFSRNSSGLATPATSFFFAIWSVHNYCGLEQPAESSLRIGPTLVSVEIKREENFRAWFDCRQGSMGFAQENETRNIDCKPRRGVVASVTLGSALIVLWGVSLKHDSDSPDREPFTAYKSGRNFQPCITDSEILS
jgi:hypothetical protein